jgi:hypothetical protein
MASKNMVVMWIIVFFLLWNLLIPLAIGGTSSTTIPSFNDSNASGTYYVSFGFGSLNLSAVVNAFYYIYDIFTYVFGFLSFTMVGLGVFSAFFDILDSVLIAFLIINIAPFIASGSG